MLFFGRLQTTTCSSDVEIPNIVLRNNYSFITKDCLLPKTFFADTILGILEITKF